MPKKLNLLGQKYGRLEVIKEMPSQKGSGAWLCRCECGNEKIVLTRSLRSGNTRSCGCLHKEITSNNFSKDITNQRFGNLVAIEPTDSRKHGSVVWKCVCDCGNIHYVSTELLLAGKTNSCGCIRSRGNQKIKELLQQMQVNFVAEYFVRINDINYYYDFAIIKDNKILCFIEYDGELHFEYKENRGWNNKENWEKTRKNDIIKNKYAEDNQIPLIRIPYFDYNILDTNYILQEMEKKLCTADILLN